MSNSTISIGFKVEDGGDGFKKLKLDAEALRKVMSANVTEAKSLKDKFIDLGAVSFGIDAATNSLNSMAQMMKGLTDAYAVQIEAETKLETVMRERMDATDAQIQSIKDLCSAQQELGIIGDEVQLAGAQQVSTFLTTQSALESLIPAMNNLLAQQKGLNATSGDAVTIGNLLGKAMQGQVDALKRVGITFTEAEKEALKFGTEEERAATLAKIITNNVGEMNNALAKTTPGQFKQISNAFGDIQEKLGGLVKDIQPGVAFLAQLGTAGGNVIKLGMAVSDTAVKFGKWVVTIKGATTALKALEVAKRGLAIGGIIAVVTYLYNQMMSLATATKELTEGQKIMNGVAEEANKKASEQLTNINLLISAAKDEKMSLEERQSAINKLNSIIPDYNAHLDDTTKKYVANKTALDDYIKSLTRQYEIEGAKAKLQEIGRQKADAKIERQKAVAHHEQTKASIEKTNTAHYQGSSIGRAMASSVYNSEANIVMDAARLKSSYQGIVDATKKYNDAVKLENEILDAYGDGLKKNAAAVEQTTTGQGGGSGGTGTGGNAPKPGEVAPEGSIKAYEQQISELEAKVKLTPDPESIMAFTRQIEELKSRVADLQIYANIEIGRNRMEEIAAEMAANPVTIKVNVDESDLQGALQDIPEEFKKAQSPAKNLSAQLNGVADVARQASSAFSSLGESMESPALDIMGIVAGAIANVMAGYASASAQAGGKLDPWGWAAFAISGLAQAMAMVTQIKQATAFADGGIVSGPTMALVGEYAGAKNNPEVIAPLNKLRDMIGAAGGPQTVVLESRIKGSDIVLATRNYNRVASVSGRR